MELMDAGLAPLAEGRNTQVERLFDGFGKLFVIL
jgi:hypothetical protein